MTLVFNGEIYNYVELREQLVKLGHTFRTTSDTEVILRMYHQYGEACVEQLNGMFAFLLHDRAKGIVLAARDHFGIKPLYFYTDERQDALRLRDQGDSRARRGERRRESHLAQRLPHLPVRDR